MGVLSIVHSMCDKRVMSGISWNPGAGPMQHRCDARMLRQRGCVWVRDE